MRLYHPDLDTTAEVPDDDGLIGVLKESGWCEAKPAEQTDPALAAEQPGVVYQAVNPEAEKPAKTAAKKTAAKDTDT